MRFLPVALIVPLIAGPATAHIPEEACSEKLLRTSFVNALILETATDATHSMKSAVRAATHGGDVQSAIQRAFTDMQADLEVRQKQAKAYHELFECIRDGK